MVSQNFDDFAQRGVAAGRLLSNGCDHDLVKGSTAELIGGNDNVLMNAFIVGNQKVSATFHRQSANHGLVGTFDDFNERPFIAAPSVNPLDSDDGSVPMEERAHF